MGTLSAPREFRVATPIYDPRLMIVWLVMLPELLACVSLLVMFHRGPVPHALHAGALANGMIAVPIAVLFVLCPALLLWAVQRRRIVLTPGVLDVTSTFYRRRLPLAALDLGKAVILDLDQHKQWRPLLKTNGIGLPGLRAGWFRSRNFTREFCLLTTWNRVLVLPEHAGGATLLSAERPQDLLQALRETADASRRAG
jgi:hypothetical protein